ncbi:MAG TPA: MupA/Atu3671 family FMN-dependent luciferase-like monooxygenase [Opitutus sp.]|nr:MupA/Atu3671 family FMN-dependent luciferase-like monooxygenase [Opitutus sp.]
MPTIDQNLADLFAGRLAIEDDANGAAKPTVTFSHIFFSDVRKDIPDGEKYRFVRELVEFADQAGFASICFPERHFYEFGGIHANNGIMAAYFAPLTRQVRLRAVSVSCPLHHPAAIVESWAMVDHLSHGRVDLGFGAGWNKADFILAPDHYDRRSALRDEMIPVIQKLWRGETVDFPGPGGEVFPTRVYPRPLQPELNVWYSTFSEHGFEHAGRHGYNIFTMLLAIDFAALEKKIALYRRARAGAGYDPDTGVVSLLIHAFVHPDRDWVQHVVAAPFKDYIRSSIVPQMKALDRHFDAAETEKIINYSYSRYFNTSGIFGPVEDCQKQVDRAVQAGVNDIAFLQDFGVDYAAVKDSLPHLKQLVDRNRSRAAGRLAT